MPILQVKDPATEFEKKCVAVDVFLLFVLFPNASKPPSDDDVNTMKSTAANTGSQEQLSKVFNLG